MPKDYLILIGAPKCGTTSFANWLGNQPDMVLTKRKETLYFTDFLQRTWSGPGANFVDTIPRTEADFEAEFNADIDATLRIEASTDNMSCLAAAENIARFAEKKSVGNIWIVAMVRDPIPRIVSEYEHTLRLGWQGGSLLDSLRAENERIEKGWHPLFRHLDRSRYGSQLARYRELFGEQLRVMDFHRIGQTDSLAGMMDWIGRPTDLASLEMEHLNQRSVVTHPHGQALFKNDALKTIGRKFVPAGLRSAVRSAISGRKLPRYQPTAEEVAFIRTNLASEIATCVDAKDIPTDFWTTV